MSKLAPTPRTDAATYRADCLGATLVTNRDLARALERELATEREKAERFRLVTLRQDCELATERGKLDWVFQNCKVEANDYTTGNRDVYYVHDREDLGVAMKEDAK